MYVTQVYFLVGVHMAYFYVDNLCLSVCNTVGTFCWSPFDIVLTVGDFTTTH